MHNPQQADRKRRVGAPMKYVLRDKRHTNTTTEMMHCGYKWSGGKTIRRTNETVKRNPTEVYIVHRTSRSVSPRGPGKPGM